MRRAETGETGAGDTNPARAGGPDFAGDKAPPAPNARSEFPAGGLIEPIDWTQAHTPYTQQTRDVDTGRECGVLVRVEGGEFATVGPADEPWLCWDASDTTWADPEPTSFG